MIYDAERAQTRRNFGKRANIMSPDDTKLRLTCLLQLKKPELLGLMAKIAFHEGFLGLN